MSTPAPVGLEGYDVDDVVLDYRLNDDSDWDTFTEERPYTNAFVFSEDRSSVLLGLKKRGFGVGLCVI